MYFAGHGELTPGHRSLVAALVHELSSTNIVDIMQFASPDKLIEALLALLDSSLEKDIKLLVINRNSELWYATHNHPSCCTLWITPFPLSPLSF